MMTWLRDLGPVLAVFLGLVLNPAAAAKAGNLAARPAGEGARLALHDGGLAVDAFARSAPAWRIGRRQLTAAPEGLGLLPALVDVPADAGGVALRHRLNGVDVSGLATAGAIAGEFGVALDDGLRAAAFLGGPADREIKAGALLEAVLGPVDLTSRVASTGAAGGHRIDLSVGWYGPAGRGDRFGLGWSAEPGAADRLTLGYRLPMALGEVSLRGQASLRDRAGEVALSYALDW